MAYRPKLSIIVPIYNQEKYLDYCIQSILNQNFQQYEIILINDGSSDGTSDICKKYEEDNRVKYIYQENKGIGATRNIGLAAANGEYLMFVDSDDAIKENSLKGLMDFVETNGFDMVYIDEIICDEDMNINGIDVSFPEMCTKIEKIPALRYCLQPAHLWARIYKRNIFEGIEFQNIWYEDMGAFPRLLSVAKEIGYYKVPIYKYRQHRESITHNDSDVKNLDVIKAWDSIIRIENVSDEEREAVRASLVDSISLFCFFKSNFAHKYIEWYRNNIHRNVSQETEDICEIKDYPFKQQAKARSEKTFLALKMIENAYVNGGFFKVNDKDLFNEACDKEGLYFQLVDGELKLVGINLEPGSVVLGEALRKIQTQNLISLKGTIKEGLVDNIVLNKGLIYNTNIFIS